MFTLGKKGVDGVASPARGLRADSFRQQFCLLRETLERGTARTTGAGGDRLPPGERGDLKSGTSRKLDALAGRRCSARALSGSALYL